MLEARGKEETGAVKDALTLIKHVWCGRWGA